MCRATCGPRCWWRPTACRWSTSRRPSAAGVSRNVYNQFDVQRNGVILNNSRTAVQTQLGGCVQGNPWLASRPGARHPQRGQLAATRRQLRGYVEVGGQRAEVIIANPAGIAVDGGGFINASRATLTTGTPQYNAAGGLESFVVRDGSVSVDGPGAGRGHHRLRGDPRAGGAGQCGPLGQ